jgi:hypothetical protein
LAPIPTLAIRWQLLSARSIIGAAIIPLERLTDQAELDAESQQGERLAVGLTRAAFAAASPHLLRGRLSRCG